MTTPAQRPATRDLRRAFTLVEMLIVISIISVLLGLLYGSLERARKFSRRAIAYTEVKNIEAALKQYYAHYHDWPANVDTFGALITERIAAGARDEGFVVDRNVADMLQGTLTDSSAQGLLDANPDRIPFVEFARFTQDAGQYVPVNPFRVTANAVRSRQYKVLFDLDNDNQIEVTDTDASNFRTNVYRSVAVWTVIPGTSTSDDSSGTKTYHDEVLGCWDNFDAK